MAKKIQVAIFDLDGTVCDDTHRSDLANAKQWDAYNAKCGEDPARPAEAFLLRATAEAGVRIVIITGRSEPYRAATEDWLQRNQLWPYVRDLYMRPAGDYRRAATVKMDIYNWLVSVCDYEVLFVVEDSTDLVNMWRGLGVTCLQCQAGRA
jgi:phosphoglycolate phosphatase-like HAD superfamily hydrolase